MAPSINSIVKYWKLRMPEFYIATDWSEASQKCWRCGCKARLHTCHIIPRSLGGNCKCQSNYVLLCRRCHEEAPNHINPDYMWIWLAKNSVSIPDFIRMKRAKTEFETMFGRKFLEDIEEKEINTDNVRLLIRSQMKRVVFHFGHAGWLNPSTVACVFREVEKEMFPDNPRLGKEANLIEKEIFSMKNNFEKNEKDELKRDKSEFLQEK